MSELHTVGREVSRHLPDDGPKSRRVPQAETSHGRPKFACVLSPTPLTTHTKFTPNLTCGSLSTRELACAQVYDARMWHQGCPWLNLSDAPREALLNACKVVG